MIVAVVGTQNLLLLSAAGIGGAIVVLQAIVRGVMRNIYDGAKKRTTRRPTRGSSLWVGIPMFDPSLFFHWSASRVIASSISPS